LFTQLQQAEVVMEVTVEELILAMAHQLVDLLDLVVAAVVLVI
jgi:hypothetical protein